MEKSESIKNIATALVKFHSLVGTVNKGSTNPFFKSKYASLPDILSEISQPMIDSGLTLSQFPTGTNGLTTILIHSESGEWMQDTYFMAPTKNTPQDIGSCITYQRRYAVGAILNLNIDEDDDGNAASTPAKPKTVPEPSATQKAAQMTKQPVVLTEAEVKAELDKIKLITSSEGLAGYYKSLTADYQANQTIVSALGEQRKKIK